MLSAEDRAALDVIYARRFPGQPVIYMTDEGVLKNYIAQESPQANNISDLINWDVLAPIWREMRQLAQPCKCWRCRLSSWLKPSDA